MIIQESRCVIGTCLRTVSTYTHVTVKNTHAHSAPREYLRTAHAHSDSMQERRCGGCVSINSLYYFTAYGFSSTQDHFVEG